MADANHQPNAISANFMTALREILRLGRKFKANHDVRNSTNLSLDISILLVAKDNYLKKIIITNCRTF